MLAVDDRPTPVPMGDEDDESAARLLDRQACTMMSSLTPAGVQELSQPPELASGSRAEHAADA